MKFCFKRCLTVLVVLVLAMSAMTLQVFAKTVTVLDGQVSIADKNGSISASDDVVTVTAKSSGFSSETNSITIYNNSDNVATLSFYYSATNYDSFTIGGVKADSSSGRYTVLMESKGELALTIKNEGWFSTATLTLENFSLVAAKESSNVTFDFDSTLGTVTVDGTAVSSGATQEISLGGAALKATPNTGVTFLGWVDADGKILSKDTAYTLTPAADMTVKAVFATTTPYFLVNNSRLYDDLNEAAGVAVSEDNKTVVLMNNATLPAGDYTIPAGVTLLIPCDAANSLATTAPVATPNSYTKPTYYRTLTMASGAEVAVDGAISVAAKQSSKNYYNGAPTESVGRIEMETGSKITVNSGGNLYAWGFITGAGSVVIESGGTVYEDFQVADWRGGNCTTDVVGETAKRVFPMSQYYVQNIEVPMTMKAGAIENGYMSLTISLIGTQAAPIPFIGSNGMFNIVSGYIVKDYIENADRLQIDVHGEIAMQPLSISMQLGLGWPTTINSENFNLPVNSNITLVAKDGAKVQITQDIALLPGAEVILESGSECTIGDGTKVYAYDKDNWGGYCGMKNTVLSPVVYAPGMTCDKRTESNLKDALVQIGGTVNAEKGFLYTTKNGANVTGVEGGKISIAAPVKDAVTYQVVQEGNEIGYFDEIAVTSAKLKNGDESYYETSKLNGSATIKYENGVWVCAHTNKYAGEAKAATCIEGGHTAGEYCPNCDTWPTEQEVIAALGHTSVVDAAVAPDCENTGLTEGKHCSVCNEVLVAQTVVDALGHTPVVDAAVAPTCTETGLTEGKHCSICNEVLVAQTVIDVLDHTEVFDAAVAPDCTNTGLTEGSHCDVCGEVIEAQEVVPAKGHTEVIDAAVAPDCENTGLTKGSHCDVCGEVLVSQTVVDALGHTEGAVVVENEVAATCTVEGSYENVVYCSDCDEELSRESKTVDVLPHTEAVDEAVAPDCTNTGLTEGKHCSVCDKVITAQEVVPAKGHTEVIDAAVAPTCTVAGLTEGSHCGVCGVVLVAREEVDAAGHDYVVTYSWIGLDDEPAVAMFATRSSGVSCAAVGVCQTANCGHEERAEAEVASEVTTKPTYTTEGVTEYNATFDVEWARPQTKTSATVVATVNGNKYTRLDEALSDAKGTEDVVVLNTAVAGEVPVEVGTSIDDGGHEVNITAARCSKTVTDEETGIITVIADHTEGNVEKENEVPATCTDAGSYDSVVCCTVCGEELSRETITTAATDHANKYVGEAKDATCTEAGHTAGMYCPDCEVWLTAQEEIPASGHTAGEVVVENEVAGDGTNNGSYDNVVYCTVCGDELSRETITTTGGTTTGGTTTGGTTTGGTTTGGTTTGGTTTGGTTTGGTTTGGTTTGGTTTGGTTTGGTTTGGTTTGGTTTGGTTFDLGDANHDGKVDSSDAVMILRRLAGYEVADFYEDTADVNGDGKADSSDAVAILRKLAGY